MIVDLNLDCVNGIAYVKIKYNLHNHSEHMQLPKRLKTTWHKTVINPFQIFTIL